jgi:hypothetical protein
MPERLVAHRGKLPTRHDRVLSASKLCNLGVNVHGRIVPRGYDTNDRLGRKLRP